MKNNLSITLDNIFYWIIDWVMRPFFIIAMIGGICAGIFLVVISVSNIILPRKEEIKITIRPAYWACTASYMSHEEGDTRVGKFSRRHYSYDICKCKQWSAYMQGLEHPEDSACSNGSLPIELDGIRPPSAK